MLWQTEEASIKTRAGWVNGRIKKGPNPGPYQVVRSINTPFDVVL